MKFQSRAARLFVKVGLTFCLAAIMSMVQHRSVAADDPPPYSCDHVTEISSAECAGLYAIWQAANQPFHWFARNATPCSTFWQGVVCTADGLSINKLIIYSTLSHIPAEIGNFPNLTELRLRGVDKYASGSMPVPATIGNLTNLKTLELDSPCPTCVGGPGAIDSLPSTIGQLSNLASLQVSAPIGSLPPEIGSISSLRILTLGQTNVTSLPEEIGLLANLNTLSIYDNDQLSVLPEELGDLPRLRSLYVANNDLITEVPLAITNISTLTSLTVEDNPAIIAFPETFARYQFPVISTFDVSLSVSEPPTIESFKSCRSGQYIIGDVRQDYEFRAQVDWKGNAPAGLSFEVENSQGWTSLAGMDQQPDANGDYIVTINLQQALNAGDGTLTLEAVSGGPVSEPISRTYRVIDVPDWLSALSLVPTTVGDCSEGTAKFTASLTYPDPPATLFITPPSFFPFVGGSEFGIASTQFAGAIEADSGGGGMAQFSGQTGFKVAGQDVMGQISGQGSMEIAEGDDFLTLKSAAAQVQIAGSIKAEAGAFDVVCKAATGGSCPLLETAKSNILLKNTVDSINAVASVSAEFQPSVGLGMHFNNTGNSCGGGTASPPPGQARPLEWEKFTGTAGGKLVFGMTANPTWAVSVQSYGGGGASITLQCPPTPSYLEKVSLNAFFGTKMVAFGFALADEATYEYTFQPANGGRGTVEALTSSRVTQTVPQWERLPRASQQDAAYARFEGDNRSRSGRSNLLVSNVSQQSAPALAGGATPIMVWTHDDVTKPAMQGEEIYFSFLGSGGWSAPAAVTNGNLQDLAPQVAVDESGNALAVWVRNKHVQTGSAEFNATYTNGFEIAWSKYDGTSWSAVQILTDNAIIDHEPRLHTGLDGKVTLTWRSNAAGMLAGDSSNPDTFHMMDWNGAAWVSMPLPALSVAAPYIPASALLIDVDIARRASNYTIATYTIDGDGDLTTADRSLHTFNRWDDATYSPWYRGPTLTASTGTTLISKPEVILLPGNQWIVLWQQGTDLMRASYPEPVVVASGVNDYTTAATDDGKVVILWQSYSADGVDIFYTTYDPDQTRAGFRDAKQLTADSAMESHLSAVLDSNANLVTGYQAIAMTTSDEEHNGETFENVSRPGQVDIDSQEQTWAEVIAQPAPTAVDLESQVAAHGIGLYMPIGAPLLILLMISGFSLRRYAGFEVRG